MISDATSLEAWLGTPVIAEGRVSFEACRSTGTAVEARCERRLDHES